MSRFSPQTRWLIGNVLITGFCTLLMFGVVDVALSVVLSWLHRSILLAGWPALAAAAYTAVTTWNEDPSPARLAAGHAIGSAAASEV